MTQSFKISQLSSQKVDTAATKHTRGPILKIFHFPKSGVPALWQEVGQEHTKRPKEKVTQFCSFKCLACGHESRHKNTQAGPPGCAGRQRHGLLWQELTEWSRRVWERQWPRSNYSLWREIPSLVWAPEGSPEKSFVNSHSPFIKSLLHLLLPTPEQVCLSEYHHWNTMEKY